MPHRILPFLSMQLGTLVDGFLLGFIAIWQGALAFISDENWDRLSGPHGLIFALSVGLIVVWTKSLKDDAARERRHKENIAIQEEHFKTLININKESADDLRNLTIESIKAQLAAASAILSMEKNLTHLANEISESSQIVKHCLGRVHKEKNNGN